MLKIIRIKLLIKDLVFVSKSSTISKINSNNNKVGKAKSQAKLIKSKNTVKPDLLIISKLLAEPNFRLNFFISQTKLAFAKLR